MATLPSFAFGDSPAMADALLHLVLNGRKTATCWAAAQGRKGVEIGGRSVVLNGGGRRCCVIETTELTERRFDHIDADWAMAEGEGDRTLDSWRADHEAYFTREGVFTPKMPLWCERFRLVEILARGPGK
jgi:uncharacterized protein YhfF